jgi:3-dehydroquinate synthase
MGYGAWLHGEGVAAGMVMAAELSVRLGLLPAHQASRLKALLNAVGLPVEGPHLPVDGSRSQAEAYLSLMRVDKKAEAGEIRFVVWRDQQLAGVQTASDALVSDVIHACLSS